jgi:N-methylhydantoinase B
VVDALDPVTFELVRFSLDAVNDEMLLSILRTVRTSIIRDSYDVSVAVCTANGDVAAQGFASPFHLGAMPDGVSEVIAKFGSEFAEGDVFIFNDPYHGGTHLPDIYLVKPAFCGGRLGAILVVVADIGDIGGRVPGSRPLDAQSIYEEGLRIPPMRYVERGGQVVSVRDLIAQNVRLPDLTIWDLDACLAALASAERLFEEVVERVSFEVVERYFDQAITNTEEVARSSFAGLPSGTYEFEDWLDDGVTTSDPVRIHVALTVGEDELTFDFSGSSDQIPASLNCTMPWTKSAVYAAVRTLLPGTLIGNAGLFRPIHVVARPGCIVNAQDPAPVAERGLTGFRILDTVLGALAQVAPGQVTAAGEGGAYTIRLGGRSDAGKYFIVADNVLGTWGARPDRDGIDGVSNFAGNGTNRPVEVLESEYPIRIRRYGLRRNSAGPGRFRGGMGIDREWELLAGEAAGSLRSDRTRFAPWGLAGGGSGTKTRIGIVRNGQVEPLPAKSHPKVRRGDRLFIEQASGGGFGSPFERDTGLVLDDWLDDKITLEHAAEAYGVRIDPVTRRVDIEGTAALRRAVRE